MNIYTKEQLKEQLRSDIKVSISKQEKAASKRLSYFTCFDFSDRKTSKAYGNFIVESQILESSSQLISKEYFEGEGGEPYYFEAEACAMFRIMVLIEFARTQGIDL